VNAADFQHASHSTPTASATFGARTREDVLGKRKAEAEPDAPDEDAGASLWTEFAKECGAF